MDVMARFDEMMVHLNQMAEKLKLMPSGAILTREEAGLEAMPQPEQEDLLRAALLHDSCLFLEIDSLPSHEKDYNSYLNSIVLQRDSRKPIYDPSPDLHIRVLQALIGDGDDLSVISVMLTEWLYVDLQRGSPIEFCCSSPLVLLFRRRRNRSFADLKFLFERYGVKQFRWCLSNECFREAIWDISVDVIRLLLDEEILPCGEHLMWFLSGQFGGHNRRFEEIPVRIALCLDLITVCSRDGVKYRSFEEIFDMQPAQVPELRGMAIKSFLTSTLFPKEDVLDLWFAKGHLAPDPETLSSMDLRILFQIAYLCLRRGIDIVFPEITSVNTPLGNAVRDPDQRKYAGLLAELITASGSPCPNSLVRSIQSVTDDAGERGSVEPLRLLCIPHVRKRYLEPDVDERFPAGLGYLLDVPVYPKLVIRKNVAHLISPAVTAKILLEDIHKKSLR